MARIVFIIEDDPKTGNVRCTSVPTFETMAKKMESGAEPSAAETYALLALRTIRDTSKELHRKDKRIIIPHL